MKITLIKPSFNLAREGLGLKKTISSGYLPSLGLAYLSAVLKSAGHQVMLIDAPAEKLEGQAIREQVRDFSPDAIGISLQIADAQTGLDLINQLPREFPGSIVLGGPYPTNSFPEAARILRRPAYLILGEGERPLANLVHNLNREKSGILCGVYTERSECAQNDRIGQENAADITGVLYRDGQGEIHGSPRTDPIPNLDSLPFPDYSLFFKSSPSHPTTRPPLYSPFPSYSRNGPALPMITSRGCPYGKCSFCFQGGEFAPPYRRHSPERVVAEMEELSRKYGIREIVFVDDIFTVNPDWVEKFCRLLREKILDLSWVCYGKADLVTPNMLREMKSAGCTQVKFGLETGDQNLLDGIRKGFSLDQARLAARWCREAGIEVNASFILGLPGETPGKGEKTVRFALEIDPDFAEFFSCQPLPGTMLYKQVCRNGAPLSPRFPGGIHEPVFCPEGYPDTASIRRLIRSAYRRFYLRPAYIAKKLRKIRSIGDIKKYAGGVQLLVGIIRS